MSDILGSSYEIENEITHKVDENPLSISRNICKQKQNTSTIKEFAFSPLEESFVKKLSADEKYVLQCFSLLGNISVDKGIFVSWIGNEYLETVDLIIRKGLVYYRRQEMNEKLFAKSHIYEAVLHDLKPGVCSCLSIKKLCENIASYLEEQSQKYKQVKPNKPEIPDELSTERSDKLEKLLFKILGNTHLDSKCISFSIAMLTQSFLHDVNHYSSNYMIVSSILTKIFKSPGFSGISAKDRVNAYCVYICTQLQSLWNCRPDSIQQIEFYVDQIINSLSMVEISSKAFSPQCKNIAYIKASLPIIEMVCYNSAGSIKINSKENPSYILYEAVVNYMEKAMSTGTDDIVLKKYKYFKLHVDEYISLTHPERSSLSFMRNVFGRNDNFDDAISRIENQNFCAVGESDDWVSRSRERDEVCDYYDNKIDSINNIAELDSILKEILADECLNNFRKAHFLYGKVKSFGFDPYFSQLESSIERGDIFLPEEESPFYEMHLSLLNGMSDEDLMQSCNTEENQQMAALMSSYIVSLGEEDNDPVDTLLLSFIFQAFMISCFMNDNESMEKYLDKYFSNLIIDPSYKRYEVNDQLKTLLLLNKAEFAYEFAQRGIDFIESHIINTKDPENTIYELYILLEILASFINDKTRERYYKEMQEKILGLGFDFKTDE